MARQEQWQLDGSAPELYERYLVPAITSLWATDLIARAELRAGERVLDVACGTGIVARLAAERVGGTGRVAGLDLNPGMLEVARSRARNAGSLIEWHQGSVLALPFRDAAFDAVFCQLGLQFFPDQPAALREMRRVLVQGGRLALNVYGPIEASPAPYALVNALDRYLGPTASVAKRTEHALADPEAVRTLVTGAGFRDVVIHTTAKVARFPSPREYVRIQLAATPLAAVIGRLKPGRRESVVEALVEEVGVALEPHLEERGVALPWEAHVVLARS